LIIRLNDFCFEFAVANGASDTVICFALFLNHLDDVNGTYEPDDLRKKVRCRVDTHRPQRAGRAIRYDAS
jgi:hypothetical protein